MKKRTIYLFTISAMIEAFTDIFYVMISIANLVFIYSFFSEYFVFFSTVYGAHFSTIYSTNINMENRRNLSEARKAFFCISAIFLFFSLLVSWQFTIASALVISVLTLLEHNLQKCLIYNRKDAFGKFVSNYPDFFTFMLWAMPLGILIISLCIATFAWYIKMLIFIVSIALIYPICLISNEGIGLEFLFRKS